MEHEAAFAKAFITSEKRARFIQFLSNPKRRKEMLNHLNHNLPYITKFAVEVPGNLNFPDGLEKLLKSKGAGPTCHVIADELKIDGHELPLGQALVEIFLSSFGSVLSCVPGRLAYYQPESPGPGIILEWPQP